MFRWCHFQKKRKREWFLWASSWFQPYQILALCFQSPPAWLVHQMKAFGGDFSTATNKWYIVGCTLHELILPSDSAVSDMSKAPVIWSFFIFFSFFCGHNWFITTSLSFRKCIYGTLFSIRKHIGAKTFLYYCFDLYWLIILQHFSTLLHLSIACRPEFTQNSAFISLPYVFVKNKKFKWDK